VSESPKTESSSKVVTTKSGLIVLAAQKVRRFFAELDFWGWAMILAIPLAVFDYKVLEGQEGLVDATVVLAEATMYLAAATFHGGRSQRLTNQKLEGILTVLLEDVDDDGASRVVIAPPDDTGRGPRQP
jgi:hypothetical protein